MSGEPNKVALLDDDIALTSEQLLQARTAISTGVDIAAFHVLDYPDVSTVDHIERIITRKPSEVSIGGNCIFLDANVRQPFFPSIYNDDWFFLLSNIDTAAIRSIGTAKQRRYVPWTQHNRIEFEQLGDIIMEGAKTNLKVDQTPFQGDHIFWRDVLDTYQMRLDRLVALCANELFAQALRRAVAVAKRIEASNIVDFMESYELSNDRIDAW